VIAVQDRRRARHWGRLGILPAMLAALVVSCTPATPSGGSSSPDGVAEPLTALVEPPATIPVATLRSTADEAQVGLLVASHWIAADGSTHDTRPSDEIEWPQHGWDTSSPGVIELEATSMPARAEILAYDAVDAATGIPIGDGVRRVCETDVSQSRECAVSETDGKLAIQLPSTIAPYVVLWVEWYVPTTMRGSAESATRWASWGFHRLS